MGRPGPSGRVVEPTPIPLERPAHWPISHFSQRQKRPRSRNALATTLKNVEAEIDTSGEFNEIWLESAKGRVPRNLSTSLVIDPSDGRIPYTREGRARWEETPHLMTERITGRKLRADTWEDRALQERCITSDAMFYPNGFYNDYCRSCRRQALSSSASRTCTTRA